MDTSWIQIFVLTFAECVAPAGKAVCQAQEFELHFLSRNDCEYALRQFVASRELDERSIVDQQKSGCAPSATESQVYADREAIVAALGGSDDWRDPDDASARRAVVDKDHRERLAELKTCDETRGRAPCKVGDIIVENTSGDDVEVWRRD